VLIATGFSLIAVASWAASTVSLRAKFIHVAFAAEIVLLTAAVLMAGPSGAALIDLFAIIAMAAFHFFAPSVAARYLPITVGLYGYLAINGGFPFGGVRTATFGLMMLLCATLIGKVRIVTRQFILQNAELSQRDALTAAANVRAMRLRVSEAVKTAAAGEREPAVIAIDLDGFKQVNDTFSHSVGDEMLVAVTRAIFDSVREEDMVARRGGDEFVVVTDAVAVTELDAIARRVGSAISESRSRIAPGLQSTASVAVAVWGQGDSANDLLRRADEQLHKNKVAVRDSEQLLVG
jgi:diguanylate cyclase (GGDEF)-like protein